MINAVDKLMKLDGVPLSRLEVQATLRLQNDPRQACISLLKQLH